MPAGGIFEDVPPTFGEPDVVTLPSLQALHVSTRRSILYSTVSTGATGNGGRICFLGHILRSRACPKGARHETRTIPGPSARRGDAFRGCTFCANHLPSAARHPACAYARGMRRPPSGVGLFSRRARHSRPLPLIASSPADGRMPQAIGQSPECLAPTHRVTSSGTCSI